MYSPPAWLPPILYLGILLWSLLCTLFFIYACAALDKSRASALLFNLGRTCVEDTDVCSSGACQ